MLSIQGEGKTSSQGTGWSVKASSSADSTEVRAAALPLLSGPPPPNVTVGVEPEGCQDVIARRMLAWRVFQCRVVPGRERAFMFPAVTADTLLLNYVFIVFFTFQFGNRKPVTL